MKQFLKILFFLSVSISGLPVMAEDGEDICEAGDGPSVETATMLISADEGTGPKYRKVGLNGFPIPDEKPQQAEETDQEPEETYIDAFTLALTHQVTDIYVPFQGTDLALAVRRNWAPEIWGLDSGLRPALHSRPDQPFGAGWRSGIAANIHFSYPFNLSTGDPGSPPYAYVTDENGTSYRFLILPYAPGGGVKFLPMPEHRHQQEVLATTLEQDGTEFVFTRKYGTKLTFSAPEISITEYSGMSGLPVAVGTNHSWSKLLTAEDRYGTEMEYTYAGSGTLIPDSIICRGRTISITMSSNRVTSVTDPRNKTTSFSYTGTTLTGYTGALVGAQTVNVLTTVTREDATTTGYAYDTAVEHDEQPRTLSDPSYYNYFSYVDLGSITDANGKTFTFGYDYDYSRQTYMYQTHFYGWYRPSGNPRNVTSVALPDSIGTSTFTNNSDVRISWMVTGETGHWAMFGEHAAEVVDAEGGVWTYTFSDPTLVRLDEFQDMIYFDPDFLNQQIPIMVLYKTMTVDTPESGQMVAEFEPSAGMALKSFQDVGSSAATTFAYADPFLFTKYSWLPTPAKDSLPTQFWGDPTSQTNALGKTKSFTYDADWRVMKRITDEEGRVTTYNIDSANGNRTDEEIKVSSGGAVVQRKEFDYDGTFKGILTKTTVKTLSGDPAWAVDLVTSSTLQAGTGNIEYEVLGTASGSSARVTQYDYDDNNNKTSVTDPRGNTTIFTYDDLNRLTVVNPPGAGQKEMEYDARGNKTKEIDERGIATLWEYDGLNRVVKQARDMDDDEEINAGGSTDDLVTTTVYNKLNSKRYVTDPRGYTTEMRYDGLQRLKKTIDAESNETNLDYSGANTGGLQFGKGFQPTTVTDARSFVTTNTYDANYRPLSKAIEYAPSTTSTTSWSYDDVGNVETETDALGNISEMTYDALNRVKTKTFAKGSADEAGIENFYTYTGLLYRVVDEESYDTLTEYDDAGRATKSLSPLVLSGTSSLRAETKTFYDTAGNVVRTDNPLNFVWTSTYDSRNRKTDEKRPGTGNPTYRWQYDDVGNVTHVTDARGNVTEKYYDDANRLERVIAPGVPVFGSGTVQPDTLTYYDKNGNIEKITDGNGNDTVNTYDVLNRLETTTDAEGNVVTYDYDAVGNRTKVYDGNNNLTQFAYDGLKRNTGVTDAAGKLTTYEYNGLNKTARVDPLGIRTEYLYDARNRLKTVGYKNAGGTVVNTSTNATRSYTYDDTNNLLSVTETAKGTKANASYTYDGLKRILTETSGASAAHAYAYDLAGNRTYALYGSWTGSHALISTYDAQNRLATLTSHGTRVTTYTYDLDGNNTVLAHPNGEVTTTTYDALNRKSELLVERSTGVDNAKYVMEYDGVGNLMKSTESYYSGNAAVNLSRTMTLSYDNTYRLETEACTGNASGTTSYGYDDASNMTALTINGTSSTLAYNNLNQVTTFVTGTRTVSYAYDDNGNRVTETDPRMTGTTPISTAYGWDYENRLISINRTKGTPGTKYEFAYDYRSRRVERKRTKTSTGDPLVPASYGMPTATGSERIVFSGGLSVREYSGTTSTVVADYVRGSDWGGGVGGIVYTLHGSAAMSANYSYNHYNARGDVTVKSNSGEGVVYAGDYTALGSRSKEYMAANNEDWQRSNTKDEDVPGYANEGFRFRDLETGVFINRDPAGFVDGPNLYCYVKQNPWSKFDPEGLSPWDDAKSFFAGSIQGVFESNGGSTVARPSGGGSSYYRGGLATGHLLGAAQGLWEMQSGGGTMAAGGALALGGAGASGTGVGAVGGLPVALVGGAGVTAGAAVTTHGALVAMNSAGHLADDFNSAMKAEGSSPGGGGAKKQQEDSKKASELPTIKPGTKEWDNAVAKLSKTEQGKLDFRTETAADAKKLLEEGRGPMDRRKQYTSKEEPYKKGYETHNDQNPREKAADNDLQHIRWKDGKAKGHIYYNKPN